MSDALTAAVAAAAREVPAHLLNLGAGAIEDAPQWTPAVNAKLVGANPAAHYRHHAHNIGQAWSEEPETPAVAVAAAMRAAASVSEMADTEHKVSLVWTGPSTSALGFRSTRAVLDTLVANATDSLVLVSFASYGVDDLVAGLAAAIDRGVDVSLILETHADSGGGLSFDAAGAFASIVDAVRTYRWPLAAREAFFGANARLHAKCVIADRSAALVTSANLTGSGINDNIELGVLIEAGPLPARLHAHFDELIATGILEQVPSGV